MSELRQVAIKLVREKAFYSTENLSHPEAVIKLFEKKLSEYDREQLIVLNLTAKNEVINIHIASMGSLDASIATPREIFKAAILSNAKSIILLHNHPSGNPTPSAEDISTTRKIQKAGELIEIKLLDHIIVGGYSGKTFSMQMENMI